MREESTLNALLAGVLGSGCKKYSDISKINNKLENLYGAVFDVQIVKKGEEQIIQFYFDIVTVVDDGYIEAIDFLKEVILNPLIDRDIHIEKENLKNRILSRYNDKTEYLRLRAVEIACKDEPFSIYADGYESDLAEITHEKLQAHYQDILKTSAIEFIVVGNACKEIEDRIKNSFDIGCDEAPPLPTKPYAPKEITRYNEDLEISQGKICILARANPESFYHLLLLNEILGSTPSSRLFEIIRQKENLCYTVRSFVYRAKNILIIEAGLDSIHFDKFIKLVQDILEGLKSLTEKEVASGKKSLINDLRLTTDSTSAILNFYTSNYILGESDTLPHVIEKINAITQKELEQCPIYIDLISTLSPST